MVSVKRVGAGFGQYSNDTAFESTELAAQAFHPELKKAARIESIDLLRGVVMIIMAIDHVRDYFHRDAFFYSPTDLTRTSVLLFFTRFITHFCAPVFVFLAGISSYLYGTKRTKQALASYLLTRGLWLVIVELVIITFGRTFNPAFTFFNLQVIWAIGVSMIVLSALVFINKHIILAIGLLLLGSHNLLDNVHFAGNDASAFFWSVLHEPKFFTYGRITISVLYPLLPWIGIMATGFWFGTLYEPSFSRAKRRKILFTTGVSCLLLFCVLRSNNFYGDAAPWAVQHNFIFSVLSFINVTKYPPSLLYTLLMLGPALIFLSASENVMNGISRRIIVFGKVPFFYYVVHIYLIHIMAMIAAVASGYGWKSMIINNRINNMPLLKGYGFNLGVVYAVWVLLILLLYPLCKWFSKYKQANQQKKVWLRYV